MTGTYNFVRPLDPGIFTPKDATVPATSGVATRTTTTAMTIATTRIPNAAKLAQQKATYEYDFCLYLEVEKVETLLRNQLLMAFDDDYIQTLRDSTDMI